MQRLSERGQAWTPEEREVLVGVVSAAREAAIAARRERRGKSSETEADDAYRRARRAYAAAVPYVAVSRCPFTGEVLRVALDDGGFDGPWWDYHHPCEPVDPPGQPESFLSFDGATMLDTTRLEHTLHTCCPGPDFPQVVAPLLGRDRVQAVLSSVPIGPHQGVLVAYFAQPRALPSPPWVDRWGANGYVVRQRGVAVGLHRDPPTGYDGDLRRWIAAGKLFWIEPGDPTLTLCSSAVSCPYISVDPAAVNPKRQWMQRGRLWFG